MKRTKRRGSVLVLFVMLFLCLLGLAALVIDMGFARLAQCQMQSAVDSAALEGLRNGPATVSGRQQAGQMVAGVFNEDLDSSGGTVQYGAGPVVNFTGGIGPTELAAAQTMSPGSPPVYQPVTSGGAPGLELNLSNAIEGDMVAGTYGVNSSYPEPTSTADEDGNYNRCDFQPALSNSTTSSAFLVRMRRTNNTTGLDREPGISSGGPTLPILFGRGSMMARSGSSGQLSVASGITVRATAIAAATTAMPARTVGRPCATASLPGSLSAQIPPPPNTTNVQLYYIVLNLSTWKALPNSSTFSFTIAPGGGIQSSDGAITYGYVADGSAADANGRPLLGPAAMVGDQANQISVPNPGALTTELIQELSPTGVAYIPVVEDNQSSLLFGRVVGFGYVTTVQQRGTNGINFAVGSSGAVAAQNASGSLGAALPAAFADPNSGLSLTTQLFSGYPTSANDLMLAPVLVNHYIGPDGSTP